MVRIQRRRRTSKITLGSKWLLALLFVLGLTGTFTYTSSRDNMATSTTNSPTIFVAAISATRILKSGKPYLLYGTAWKKERTAALVEQAITSGFRFIDTACQPRHYNEPGVGEGIVNGMKKLGLQRSDLFIQTKYTPYGGQDPNNIPYDPNAELEDQVEQSIAVSLRNLRTEYIDSLVLHSPLATHGQTMRVWRALEKKVEDGIIGQLGISNCYDLNEFKRIYEEAKVKPSVLQNRFYSDSGFDIGLRSFCDDHSILYQSFWTLTSRTTHSNLQKPEIREMAKEKGLSPQTLMYAYMMELGHTPLSGTTNEAHMMEDVALMERVQNGEQIMDENEIAQFSQLLGITN